MGGRNGYYSSNLRSEKTLSVSFRLREGKIEEIKISGDFFEFPEGAIDELEKRLLGKDISEALREIEEFEITLCGISKEDLKRAILEAINDSEA